MFFSSAEEAVKDGEFSYQKLQPFAVCFQLSKNWFEAGKLNYLSRNAFTDCRFILLSAWSLGEPTVWSCLFARDRENVNFKLTAIQEVF